MEVLETLKRVIQDQKGRKKEPRVRVALAQLPDDANTHTADSKLEIADTVRNSASNDLPTVRGALREVVRIARGLSYQALSSTFYFGPDTYPCGITVVRENAGSASITICGMISSFPAATAMLPLRELDAAGCLLRIAQTVFFGCLQTCTTVQRQ